MGVERPIDAMICRDFKSIEQAQEWALTEIMRKYPYYEITVITKIKEQSFQWDK